MRKIAIAVVFVLLGIQLSSAQDTSGTGLGPNQYNLTIGTSATMAAVAANPTRRGLMICNGNPTALNVITVTFGPVVTPVDGVTGIIIPGGQVTASCLTLPPSGMGFLSNLGAQLNIVAHAAATPVSVAEFY